MACKRKRPNSTSTGSSAAGGCRRKSSSASMEKLSPGKIIPSCVPTWHLIQSFSIHRISRLFTGENSVRSPTVGEGNSQISRDSSKKLPSLTVGLLTRIIGENHEPQTFHHCSADRFLLSAVDRVGPGSGRQET